MGYKLGTNVGKESFSSFTEKGLINGDGNGGEEKEKGKVTTSSVPKEKEKIKTKVEFEESKTIPVDPKVESLLESQKPQWYGKLSGKMGAGGENIPEKNWRAMQLQESFDLYQKAKESGSDEVVIQGHKYSLDNPMFKDF